MFRKLFIFFSLMLAVNSILLSQENNSLYFMKFVPESNITNPSIQCNCKFNLSLIVFNPVNVNISNTGFNYSDIIHKGTGVQKDSLVFDVENFLKKLKKNNFLFVDLNFNILSLGIKTKNYYYTFNVTDKVNFRFSYPKGFVNFVYEGNGKSYLGNTADLGGLGFTANYYREYAFGIATSYNKKLDIGIKPKLLFGKLNLYSRRTNLTDNTSSNDFSQQFHGDFEINSSQPFLNFNDLRYDYGTHQVEGTVTDNNTTLKKIMTENRNIGLGLDMGVNYKYRKKLTLYGSLIDLGFIRWTTNVNSFISKGNFDYSGLNIIPYMHKNDTFSTAYSQHFLDSIMRIYNPRIVHNSYFSYLTAKIFIGGEYSLNNRLSLNLLTRTEIVMGSLIPSATLSGIVHFNEKIGACLSYSYINHSFLNAGAGVMFKLGFLQFYAVTDNLFAVFEPLKSKNVNLNLGFNFLFGCPKPKYSGNTYL